VDRFGIGVRFEPQSSTTAIKLQLWKQPESFNAITFAIETRSAGWSISTLSGWDL
jgi:hypothetical protein